MGYLDFIMVAMFKDFKYQKTVEYATFRILSSEQRLDEYRWKYDALKNYTSGIVFPEQMIGYSGLIYIVAYSKSPDLHGFYVSKKQISGAWAGANKLEDDSEAVSWENKGFTVLLNQNGGGAGHACYNDSEFAFLSKKQASKFAQNLLDKKIKGL